MTNPIKPKNHVAVVVDSIVAGAVNSGYGISIQNLHDLIEGIRAADGIHMRVSAIRLTVRAYSDAYFSMYPAVVQTAGNFTDSVSLTQANASALFDACIDDVMGYDGLFPYMKIARRVPTGATDDLGVEYSVNLSPKILQILNKEVETERLQNLLFAICGFGTINKTVALTTTIEVMYIEQRKQVVLR